MTVYKYKKPSACLALCLSVSLSLIGPKELKTTAVVEPKRSMNCANGSSDLYIVSKKIYDADIRMY